MALKTNIDGISDWIVSFNRCETLIAASTPTAVAPDVAGAIAREAVPATTW